VGKKWDNNNDRISKLHANYNVEKNQYKNTNFTTSKK